MQHTTDEFTHQINENKCITCNIVHIQVWRKHYDVWYLESMSLSQLP